MGNLIITFISLFEINNRDIKNRQEFININHMECREVRLIDKIDNDIIEKQSKLFMDYRYILNYIYEHKNKEVFRDYYISRLVELGIADGKHKVNQDILHDRFIEYYGQVYLKLLGCELAVGDNSTWLTKITRKHRTFFHPLYHLLVINFLGIDIKKLFSYRFDDERAELNITNEQSEDYRSRWICLMNENPQKSKTALRGIDCSVYTFLYRYDREWLNENSPIRKAYKGIQNIDWDKRDEEILEKVKTIIKELINSKDKPERITIGLIGRKINKSHLFEKYLDKMPKSKKLIEKSIESLEEFQKRRIEWVKDNCFKDELVSEWKVNRKAGIKSQKI